MNSFPQSRQRKNSAVTFVVIVVLLAIIFITNHFLHGVISRALGNTLAGAMNVVISRPQSELQKENESLKRENTLLRQESAQIDFLKTENASLKSYARLADELPGKTARIVSAPRSSVYGTFLIDIGSREGIQTGDVVLTEAGFALGTISAVYNASALVSFVFGSGVHTEAAIGSVVGDFSGQGATNAIADVPRDAKITLGDVAYAPRLKHPIGIVSKIATSSASATQRVFITVPGNFFSTQFVYVETNAQ